MPLPMWTQTWPEKARRATGRPDAHEMLARYQTRMDVHRRKFVWTKADDGGLNAWTKCLEWQLAWENEILRYRDSNNNGEDNGHG